MVLLVRSEIEIAETLFEMFIAFLFQPEAPAEQTNLLDLLIAVVCSVQSQVG